MKTSEVIKLSPYERLKYWVQERESIRLRRLAGDPPPWTDDAVLATYRFTNVRRMDDRVSSWLLSSWYLPYRDHPNMLWAVAVGRFFNQPSTLEHFTGLLFRDGPPLWDRLKKTARALPRPIFRAAYMVRGNDGVDKVESVVEHNVRPLRASYVSDRRTMRVVWQKLEGCYGFGSFMAGQVTADARWGLTGEWADRHDWAPVGPGSARGLGRLVGGDNWKKAAARYAARQDVFLADLRAHVITPLTRDLPESITNRLEAQDWQSVCCEYMKYCKALLGEGRPKQLYRPRPEE